MATGTIYNTRPVSTPWIPPEECRAAKLHGATSQDGVAPSPKTRSVTKTSSAKRTPSKREAVRALRALFHAGRYGEAASLYDDSWHERNAPAEAALIRARLYLRSDVAKTVAFLNRLQFADGSEDEAWRLMLLGEAHALLDDYSSADDRFDAAMSIADRRRSQRLAAEVAYRIGRRHIMANDPAAARRALDVMYREASASTRLDALHLDSFILSRDGRFFDQARVLIELLRALDPARPVNMEHRAWATHSLAALAREIWVPDAIPEVERQLAGPPWPVEFNANRFQSLKALAWAKALNGDYFNAFRYLSQATRFAPSPAWQTMLHCDRAYLACVTGERRWSRQEIVEAQDSAAATNWRDCNHEEPVALLLLAELLAPIDAARASEYLAIYRSLRDASPSRSLLRRDPRNEAMTEYATGVVEGALGHAKTAKQRVKHSKAVYKQLRYDWRAARCDLQLFRLTRDESFLESAAELLTYYGSSWLAEELRAAAGPQRTNLPPMQERVFRHICEGLSNAEIAARLGRSENTVANHAKAVLKSFGVSTRGALIALAMKRGLL